MTNAPGDETIAERLRQSEERWRTLAENVPDIILTIDRDRRIEFINRVEPGYRREETIGRPVCDFVPPEQADTLRAKIDEVFQTGKASELEVQDIRNRRWFHSRFTPILRDGRVTSIVVICTDITDYRRQAEALKESEARARRHMAELDQLYDTAPVGLAIADTDLRILRINNVLAEKNGLTVQEHLGKTLREILPAAVADEVEPALREVIETGRPEVNREVTVWTTTTPSVQHFHLESYWPLISDDGNIWGVSAIIQDITEQKRVEAALQQARDELEERVARRTQELAEANKRLRRDIARRKEVERALRESQERFRTIAETIPVPIVITRLSDGAILYTTDRLGEMFGAPQQELVGRKSEDFYYDFADRKSLIDHVARQGFVRDYELRVKKADGTPFWISVSMQPLHYEGEDALLSGFQDITERKRHEAALERDRQLLRRLLDLNERDRQLVAYEIHDGIVQDVTGSLLFLEAAAHELSTEGRLRPESLARVMRLLRESLAEARRMIDGLRPPVLEEAGVVAAIENLVAEITAGGELSVEFVHEVRFDRLAPTLEMAVFRIAQESLTNIVRHSGSPKARVELIQQGNRIRMTIRDWGAGFDPAKVAKKRYGLAGVRERARLLGGRAEIDSEPGKGTRICVELPLTDVLLPADL